MTHYVSADTYNIVAGSIFQRHYALPIRAQAERYTFFRMMGDCTGLSVLDLACGEGWYPRQMKERGAGRVVGIDLSDKLIEFAQLQERQKPLGIEYRVGDMSKAAPIGEFDVVTGQLMLHYAATREQFQGTCDMIAGNLKPGGRFVCIGFNPFMSPEAPSMRKYGVNLVLHNPLRDGDRITGQIYLDTSDTPTVEISHHYWEPSTYETCLQKAGMTDVQWHRAQVSQEGLAEYGPAYWADFLNDPFLIGTTAVKR